jgi:hypothetical protein
MTIPKHLIIGGVKWRIILDKKLSGGAFGWHSHTIRIEKKISSERKFNILIHEICEIIMVNNMLRFRKCTEGEAENGDYLFSYNHDGFENFTDELSGILKQLKF